MYYSCYYFVHLARPQAADLAGRQRDLCLAGREKRRLSREPAEKNSRLSRRERCGLITEKFIITVFTKCKVFAMAIFVVSRRSYVFFVFITLCIKRIYFNCTGVITKRTNDLT